MPNSYLITASVSTFDRLNLLNTQTLSQFILSQKATKQYMHKVYCTRYLNFQHENSCQFIFTLEILLSIQRKLY